MAKRPKRQNRHVSFPPPFREPGPVPHKDDPNKVAVEIQLVDSLRLAVEDALAIAQKFAAEGREVEFTLGDVTFEHWGRRYRVRIDEVK